MLDIEGDLENRFTHHLPKGSQVERYRRIRKMALNLGLLIEDLCPDSMEKSLALTSLEISVMWANKAIARNE